MVVKHAVCRIEEGVEYSPVCASGEPFSVAALLLTQKNLNSLSENSVHFT